MSSINKVIIVGNLGKDPETRYATSGDAVTNVTIATSEKWKGRDGKQQEKTEWHRVVFFKQLAEIVHKYLKKGSLIYIEGRLQTRKWDDKGVERYTTEIVADKMQMLGGSPQGDAQESPAPRRGLPQRDDFVDDLDIPF